MNHVRIASLLSTGLPASQVATIVGVSPARISQLLKEESFSLLLADKTALAEKDNFEELALSAKYNAAEHSLIQQVMDMAPVSELRDVTAALRVVAERQEKMKSRMTTPVQSAPQVIVSITLPSHALPTRTIEMTSQKEVISIGEHALAPMSSTAVTNLFATLRPSASVAVENKGGTSNEQSPSNRNTEESPQGALQEESFLSYE